MAAANQTIKFAHIFKHDEEFYLYIAPLGNGFSSHAQLVLNVKSRQVQVRKVRHRRLILEDLVEDNEVRIAKHLKAFLRSNAAPPRIARLLSSEDMLAPGAMEDNPLKISRVSLWDFYNGGTLSKFIETYQERNRPIPLVLICRFIRQVLETLNFCYKAGVVHNDLNSGNIWVHWPNEDSRMPDFFVGDFGMARVNIVDARNACVSCGALVLHTRLHWDVQHLRSHAQNMVRTHRNRSERIYMQARRPLNNVFDELDRLNDLALIAPSFPDLCHVIRMVRELETTLLAHNPPKSNTTYRALFDPQIICATTDVTPRYYDSRENALAATHILGPWFIAQVDTRTTTVLSIDAVPHHRPNTDNAESDTNSLNSYGEIDSDDSFDSWDPFRSHDSFTMDCDSDDEEVFSDGEDEMDA